MKKVYIKTVGCQMNVLDSEMVIADLKRHGYSVVDSPEEADCVLYNTCSVREHAEEKVYSALGTIRQAKEKNPEKTIGVMGCMAQKDQEIIFKRAPFVDLVVGSRTTAHHSRDCWKRCKQGRVGRWPFPFLARMDRKR